MIPALETRRLGKQYGRTWALQDCSLTIAPGHVTALVGPNGAGKTTLFNLATGFLPPTTGEVRTLGRVGFVAQGQPLYRSFTVDDMLTMGRRLNRIWDDERAPTRLRRLRILFHRPVGRLSSSQQAQVALALALGRRPELLLLDKPLASLDPLARHDLLSTLMESVADEGLSVILSSHDIADLARVCDHLVILSASRVVLEGDLAEVLRTHKRLTGPRRIDGRIVNVDRGHRGEARRAPEHAPGPGRRADPRSDLAGPGRAEVLSMIWLTSRQHRAETLVLGGILLVAVAGLVLVELASRRRSTGSGWGPCASLASGSCGEAASSFNRSSDPRL